MTKHLKKISVEECIGADVDSFIEQILQNRFTSGKIEQYIKERNLLVKDFCQYSDNIEFYQLEVSYNRKDIKWIASTVNKKEEFAVLIIDLPITLDYHNTEIKPIQAYCGLWYEYSSENDRLYNLSTFKKEFKIISLGFNEFGVANPKLEKNEFINRVLSYNIGIYKIPNEKELLAIDEIERNKVSIEYIDIDGEDLIVETTGEKGYFMEIEGMEYEIDLQNVSEEDRFLEIKKQVYSHIYTFNSFFHDVWSSHLCRVKLQHEVYRLLEEVTNDIFELANLFVSKLENIRVFAIEEDLYLIGQLDNQKWIIIHHIATRDSK